MICSDYLLCRSLEEPPEIQVSSTSCGSLLDAKIGLTHGKDLALVELGRGDKQFQESSAFHPPDLSFLICHEFSTVLLNITT